MKISIYSSGDNPPFWNIVFGQLTLKELEGTISLSSMLMNAAREAKLKIKDEDPNQLKLEFDAPLKYKEIDINEKAKKKKEMIDMHKRENAYHGLGTKTKLMLEYLWENYGKQELSTTGKEYFAALKQYKIPKDNFNSVLRNRLEPYGHCTCNVREEGRRILDSFKLHLTIKNQ